MIVLDTLNIFQIGQMAI